MPLHDKKITWDTKGILHGAPGDSSSELHSELLSSSSTFGSSVLGASARRTLFAFYKKINQFWLFKMNE